MGRADTLGGRVVAVELQANATVLPVHLQIGDFSRSATSRDERLLDPGSGFFRVARELQYALHAEAALAVDLRPKRHVRWRRHARRGKQKRPDTQAHQKRGSHSFSFTNHEKA